MDEPSHLRNTRRRTRRACNDARLSSHYAWVLRMETLELRLRAAALAQQNVELLERIAAR